MRRNTNTRAPLLVLAFFALLLGMVRPPPGKLTIPQYPVSAHGSGMFESRPFFVRPPGVMPFNRLVWYPHRHHVRARHSYRWRFSHHHRFLEQFATPIQHVVIVYMENRTPDNLFSGYYSYSYPPGGSGATWGSALDLANPAGPIPALTPIPFEAKFDPDHTHRNGFVTEAAGYWNDELLGCPAAYCPGADVLAYVPTAETTPYAAMVQNYAYGSHVLQSNEGPSLV